MSQSLGHLAYPCLPLGGDQRSDQSKRLDWLNVALAEEFGVSEAVVEAERR